MYTAEVSLANSFIEFQITCVSQFLLFIRRNLASSNTCAGDSSWDDMSTTGIILGSTSSAAAKAADEAVEDDVMATVARDTCGVDDMPTIASTSTATAVSVETLPADPISNEPLPKSIDGKPFTAFQKRLL